MNTRRFADLNEREVLALAIANEDEDNRIVFDGFAPARDFSARP